MVLGWLSKVFASEADADGPVSAPSVPSVASLQDGQPANSVLKQWRCHMHQFFCRIYVNMRIEELFSIIRGQILNAAFSFVFVLQNVNVTVCSEHNFRFSRIYSRN